MVQQSPEYLERSLVELKAFLEHELRGFDKYGEPYSIAYVFLRTMLERIRAYIKAHAPVAEHPDILDEHRLRLTQERLQYLQCAQTWLTKRAARYQPGDGSVWEDVKRGLETIAHWVADDLRHEPPDLPPVVLDPTYVR